MYKYLSVLIIIGLSICIVMQYDELALFQSRMDALQQDNWDLQQDLASVEGLVIGWHIASYKDKNQLMELSRLIKLKDHLINSMQKGKQLLVTAYTADSTETDETPFITASNTRVREGIVAVSQDLFAKGWVFGKKVYIVNKGVYTIEDLLHKRKRNQLDIFMNNKMKALNFGRKKLKVFLLGS